MRLSGRVCRKCRHGHGRGRGHGHGRGGSKDSWMAYSYQQARTRQFTDFTTDWKLNPSHSDCALGTSHYEVASLLTTPTSLV